MVRPVVAKFGHLRHEQALRDRDGISQRDTWEIQFDPVSTLSRGYINAYCTPSRSNA
jgi:hypothetical protein